VLDHISIQCADVLVSSSFYDVVLPVLGSGRMMDFGSVIGYGQGRHASFWLSPVAGGTANRELHLAFEAENRATVRRFFEAAREAGAEILHEPRLWPEYDADYYATFVRDPDGNNVEAVCRSPQEATTSAGGAPLDP
jgi:catechol 2,3-dioxygenase-like lactoylglutathione lyase family enzyme